MAVLFERKFVFLLPEHPGYERAMGQTPKGHIEIEKKGEKLNFKVFLENLKEMAYQIQLFTSAGRYVLLDEVLVGQSGKKEEEYHTRSLDVFYSGIAWEEFEVIVIRPLGEENKTKAVLVAWLDSTKSGKKKVPYIKEENKQKLKQDQFDESTLVQNLEEPEELEELEEIPEVPKVIQEEMEEEIEETQEKKQKAYTNLEWEEYWVGLDEDIKEEYPEQPETPYHYLNQNIEKWEKLASGIEPFMSAMENHRWWKIAKNQKDLEGFYIYFNGSFVHLTYPYMHYNNIGEAYVQEYNYMLFGIVFDKDIQTKPNYYVYGIPGRLCAQDQPFQGKTGFLYWHPAENDHVEKGAMGYWLLYVDAYSGAIAIPQRPTIAPICEP